MASKNNKSVSLRKYKNIREFNLAIFLFIVVFIYLLVTIFIYLTGDNISIYEVRKGSIVKDNSYTGLVIREETAINAEADGYISYYQNENSKVKTGSYIYALSPEKLSTTGNISGESVSGTVSQEVQTGIILQVQNFVDNYRSSDFSAVYSLKNEIGNTLQNVYSTTKIEQIGAAIAASGMEVTSYATQRDGVIAFSVDGYESVTKDSFTADYMDRSNYENIRMSDQMQVKTGEPVYRLITSENWSVIIQLTRETAEMLRNDEVTTVKTRIDKDSEMMWADITVMEKDGSYYGCLDYYNSMIRYADERYLNVELILEDESGLKIPKSAVVEEKFYVVPQEYMTTGGNSSASGFMVENKKGDIAFRSVDIFDISDNGEVCISRDDLEEGEIIIMPDSSDTYTVGKTKSLQGVYNVNKGYAVFKKVSILCENDEYYIVKEGESYGLSNYDHIVQNGSSVSPEEVVFQ